MKLAHYTKALFSQPRQMFEPQIALSSERFSATDALYQPAYCRPGNSKKAKLRQAWEKEKTRSEGQQFTSLVALQTTPVCLHYLSCWLLSLFCKSLEEEESSKTGFTNPAYSELPLSSIWVPTKSFSHSSPLESSEVDVGLLPVLLPLGLSAARSKSSSVFDRSLTGIIVFIPSNKKESKLKTWPQQARAVTALTYAISDQ